MADLAAWSLWATVARCVPELSKPIHEHAPTVMALCGRLERNNEGTTRTSQAADAGTSSPLIELDGWPWGYDKVDWKEKEAHA